MGNSWEPSGRSSGMADRAMKVVILGYGRKPLAKWDGGWPGMY